MFVKKTIKIFLIDEGVMKCTVDNWHGVALKISRSQLEKYKDRDELKSSGVYFLFGENKVYIGQAANRKNGGGILNRLSEHKRNAEKDYWDEAIIFTTVNNLLGLTEISFLENKFCNLALDAKRYEVKNGNEPSIGNVTEEKEWELNEFTEYVKMILHVLGYKVFEPLKEISDVVITPTQSTNSNSTVNVISNSNEPIFYLSRKIKSINATVTAKCKKVDNGYIVLAGSQICPVTADYVADDTKKTKENAKLDENNILLEDMAFKTPSAAARFVTGLAENGWVRWKTENGTMLKDFYDDSTAAEPIFYLLKKLRGTNIEIKAMSKKTESGFVVLAGSKISPTFQADAKVIINARNIAKLDDENILQNDIFFPHPTPAATFVFGKHLQNGWDAWKTEDGVTLKNFYGDDNV